MKQPTAPGYRRSYSATEKYACLEPVLAGRQSEHHAAQLAGVAYRTVQRWLSQYKQHGLAGLDTACRADQKKPRPINTEWQEVTRALALARPAYQISDIYAWMVNQATLTKQTPPTYPTVRRWFSQLEPALLVLARKGSEAYRQECELVYRWETASPNALWQADHTPLDVAVVDDKGRVVRPWLTLIEDDYSRCVCGFYLSVDHPNALHTALALRHAIYPKGKATWPVCGIPQRLYTDRGRDFLSKHLAEICLRLHIEVVRTRPRRPRGKGKVERLFGSLNTGLLRTLPGYTKAPAPDPSPSLLTLKQLEAKLEAFITDVYLVRAHRSTGQPPLERWQAGGFVPQQPPDWSILDTLLLTVSRPRRILKDGIHFRGLRYLSTVLTAYVGEWVTIRYDPRDLAEIRVYLGEACIGKAVCVLISDQTVSLKELDKARRQVNADRRTKLRQARNYLDALTSVTPPADASVATPAPEVVPVVELLTPTPPSTGLKLYAYGHRTE